jgi:hypothetical protein
MGRKPILTRRELMIGAVQGTVALVILRPAWAATLPKMVVNRDPNCGCCGAWVEHVKAAGFPVEVVEAADLGPLKAKLGVPEQLTSCHTAEVGGYVVEGHVPAGAIAQLLIERPQASGLAVPGMPVGSPGMEIAGKPDETYEVMLFGPHGRRVFRRYRGLREV